MTAQFFVIILQLPLLITANTQAILYTRLCENQGNCLSCGEDRISYYKCHNSEDCAFGEHCSSSGFCCPKRLDQISSISLFSSDPVQNYVSCGINEEYVNCFDPCQPTCSSLSPKPCPLDKCLGGCHCKKGYVRVGSNPQAICVPISECLQETGMSSNDCLDPLKEYTSCGSACPIACSNRNVPRDRCNEKCIPGCFCKIPYIVEDDSSPITKCILPAQCPMIIASPERSSISSASQNFNSFGELYLPSEYQKTPHNLQIPVSINYLLPNSYNFVPSSTVRGYFCTDPLKNFLACGSACPVGCNNRIAGTCGVQCVSGCFCRTPYILKDAHNVDSGCVLPEKCDLAATSQQVCTDPRKQWTPCASLHCARSCVNQKGVCNKSLCNPGCACREPYVLKDSSDPNSACILASECPSETHCEDQLKEYHECASSCPMGCNNPNPKTCTPCVSGCFCKMGFIFEDALRWRTSKCIPINQCPNLTSFIPSDAVASASNVIDSCPIMTADNSGRECNTDQDCLPEQKCCPPSSFAFNGGIQHRCTCSDPHAVWDSCGSLCPEYCSQPSIPVCSATCKQGCRCAAGYVRSRNDITAPCVSRAQCLLSLNDDDSQKTLTVPWSPFDDEETVAAVYIGNGEKNVSGKVNFATLKDSRLKVWGVLYDLPPGEHALVMHQFGDTSNSCSNIGPVFEINNTLKDSAFIGNVESKNGIFAEMSKVLEWTEVQIIAGRSLAVHSVSVANWTDADSNKTVLACGTVGLVSK